MNHNMPAPRTDAIIDSQKDSTSEEKVYVLEKLLRQIETERNIFSVELCAWKESFGTSQLSHALAERDSLISENKSLKAIESALNPKVLDLIRQKSRPEKMSASDGA